MSSHPKAIISNKGSLGSGFLKILSRYIKIPTNYSYELFLIYVIMSMVWLIYIKGLFPLEEEMF